jgi:urease accessory protein
MDATTEIEVALDGRGNTVVRRMQCEAPLLVRAVEAGGPVLHLAMVNGAAGPLGGDRLTFRLHVGAGASVDVRSVAAAMAQPGPSGEPSTLMIDLNVGDGAALRWSPEPMVSVIGSDHRTTMTLSATSTSTVEMCEGISLGRHGEASGRLAMRQRVTIDGAAVLDHETVFAPGALSGPGAHGPGRTVTSVVHIGPELPPPCSTVTPSCVSATFHLSPLCALTTESRVCVKAAAL